MNDTNQLLADLDHYEEREYPVSREDRILDQVEKLITKAATVQGSIELAEDFEADRLLMIFAIWRLSRYSDAVLGDLVKIQLESYFRHCAESEVGE